MKDFLKPFPLKSFGIAFFLGYLISSTFLSNHDYDLAPYFGMVSLLSYWIGMFLENSK